MTWVRKNMNNLRTNKETCGCCKWAFMDFLKKLGNPTNK